MSAGAIFDRLHEKAFAKVAIAASWLPAGSAPGAEPTEVRVKYHHSTIVASDLGDVLDPRPSVEMERKKVGDKPTGSISIPAVGDFTLDRPVHGGDEYVVPMFLRPVPV